MKKFFNYLLLFLMLLGFFAGLACFMLYFTDTWYLRDKEMRYEDYIQYSVIFFSVMSFAGFYLWKNNFFKKN